MNLRPEEISAVIKEQIKNYKNQINVSDYTVSKTACLTNFFNSQMELMAWH